MIQVHLDLNNYDLGHVIRLVAGLAASHHTEITPCVRRRGGIMRALQKLFSVLAWKEFVLETLLVNRISNGVILMEFNF